MSLKKITKHVWVDKIKWKVEKVISPNKYDDYLLLSRLDDKSIHADGKTTPLVRHSTGPMSIQTKKRNNYDPHPCQVQNL